MGKVCVGDPTQSSSLLNEWRLVKLKAQFFATVRRFSHGLVIVLIGTSVGT